MAEIDLAGMRLGVSDEVLQVFRRKILAECDDAEGLGDHADGDERVRREGQLRIDRIGRRACPRIADGNRITVRRRTRRARQCRRATCTDHILDDDGLPERNRHLLGDDTRDHVRRAAGREGHDHGDGARGIGLGRSRDRRGKQQREGGGASCERRRAHHAARPRWLTRPVNRPRPSVLPMMSST